MELVRSTGSSQIEVISADHRSAWRLAAITSVSLAFAIVLGAFGAHGLKNVLPPERLVSFETASRYHFYSCFFLYFLTWLRAQTPASSATARLTWAQQTWGWGTVVFCGSVYLVAVRGIIGMESASWLGAIAPVGGLLLIIGAVLTATYCWGRACEG